MEGWQLFLVYFLLCLVIIAGFSLFTSWRYSKKLDANVITRGANGVGGDTVTLTCPEGQVISFNNQNPTAPRVVYICTSPDANNFENQSCDPFYSGAGQLSHYFNPSTTQDQSSNISSACAGQQTCTWSIPSSVSNICNGGPCNGTIQMIGTYDCVPK